MNLLLFSDLHCDSLAAKNIAERASNVDVLVGAGDFANARRGIEVCLNILSHVQKPTILVPGNNESYDELVAATKNWKQARVLHGSCALIDGVAFFGIGGGVPVTPFGPWSFDLTEDAAIKLLASCPAECVLVSHSPPKGAVDVSSSGKSLGSTAVRTSVLDKKPKLVVCGHIHHSAGQQANLGSSTVINAGPGGMEYDI